MFLGNAVKIALSGRNSQKDVQIYENVHGKIRRSPAEERRIFILMFDAHYIYDNNILKYNIYMYICSNIY